VLEQGMAKNVFTEQRDKERAGRLLEAAKKLAVTAKQGLARDEQAAAAAPNGEVLVAVGTSYLINANDPVKAVPLITQGIAKGGLKNVNDAYINLGLAQARNKNVAEAQKAFGKVDKDAGYERLAKLWALRTH
jgi:L-aminopeptidase/D-esterase-like protein